MNQLKWMGHSATILDIHKSLHNDLESCEVTLIARGYAVKAHRFVLSSCSDLLRCLLCDIPLEQECTIVVPDINGALLDSVMTFIYLGETHLSSSNLSEFLETINVLGIKSAISFECITNTNILQNNNISPNTSSILNSIPNYGSTNIAARIINTNGAITTTTMNETARGNDGCGRSGGGGGGGGSGESTLTLTSPDIMNPHNNNLKLEASHVITIASEPQISNSARELEFLDVYHEALPHHHHHHHHHKITYSIEHISDPSHTSEFMLTENSNAFTIAQNPKIESTSSTTSVQMDVCVEDDGNGDVHGEGAVDADGLGTHIIDEFSSPEDPLLPLTENTNEDVTTTDSNTDRSTNTAAVIQTTKQCNDRGLKFKIQGGAIIQPKLEHTTFSNKMTTVATDVITPASTSDGQMRFLHETDENQSYSIKDNTDLTNETISVNESNSDDYAASNATEAEVEVEIESGNLSATDLAYQAMVNENLSLPKAAVKFNVSKTELWRRVRNTGVEHYLMYENQTKTNTQDEAINLACQAVIMEGYSLQKAAVKYDISKTVLWRRVRKHPDYMKTVKENPVVAKAYDRLKSGESLKTISQDLDIPMSTLHRHKVRLSQQGQLPDFVTCKRRDANSKDNLKIKLAKAVHACVHQGMSQNHAASLFEISKSTLWRHLQKRVAEAEAADINEQRSMNSMDEEEDNVKDEVILS